MKIATKAPSVFAAVILSASFAIAQQQAPATQQQAPTVFSNNIELVLEGKVIDVHDGDTVTVVDQTNQKFHIRLHGIDAPELKQEFGLVSQKHLARMVLGKEVSIFWTKVDKYRRTVGTIKIDGRDINIEQVKAGMAWHFKKYQDEQEPQDRITYAAAEEQARAGKLGLWQDPDPMVPGDWRQGVKAKRWGPPPPPGTIIGNSNSKRYHRPDCAGYRDMAERNRVFFKSVAEAEAAGYKRAGNCPAEIQVSTSTSPAVSTVSPVVTTSPSTAASSVVPITAAPATRSKSSLLRQRSRLIQSFLLRLQPRSQPVRPRQSRLLQRNQQAVFRPRKLSVTRTARFTICPVVQPTIWSRKKIRSNSILHLKLNKRATSSQAVVR